LTYPNERSVLKHLKEDPLAKAYFIYGEESRLNAVYFEKTAEKSGAACGDSFNFQKFDFAAINVDKLADACMSLPVFAPRKCVAVRDADIEALPKPELDKLYELLENLPEETCLIIAQINLKIDAAKSAKYKKFLKAFDKIGAVFNLPERSPAELVKFAQSYARKNGSEISPAAASKLRERCLSDMNRMIPELDKLCAFRGGEGPNLISEADIELLVARQLDTSVFELSRQIKKGDYSRAMAILGELKQNGEEAVSVLAALSSVYIDLFRAMAATESGKTPDDVKKDFPYRGKEFLVRAAFADARAFSQGFVGKALEILSQADFEIKSSGSLDPFIILEKAATKLFILKAEGG
jgi:DNA polymerase-3 subunit delta